mgnify:FL=1
MDLKRKTDQIMGCDLRYQFFLIAINRVMWANELVKKELLLCLEHF